jgi:uncharacterized protein (DUF433 family)
MVLSMSRREGLENANDVRARPAYGLAEAARYLKLSPATLRSWSVGRPYPTTAGIGHFQPLLRLPAKRPPTLSFWNLIEAHVLRSLRTDHGLSVQALRKALRYAEQVLVIERLLLRNDLCTDAGRLFLERYGELIDLSASGQLAMRKVFDEYLKRVEWDGRQFPTRLYPFVSGDSSRASRPITIDPQVAFGRPVVQRAGVSTSAIADRVDAGETVADLVGDYGLSEPEIEQAVLYERAA